MKPKKIALGMSGGVDSSVCAHMLVEQGYEVTGVFLECWRAPGCRSEADRADALKVALKLGIPFEVLDFKDAYKNKVVEYFFTEYEAGRTPNPDVLCNKEIKFGLFYDWAMQQGFDAVATGHYARIVESEKSDGQKSLQLAIPADTHKDQTYFLYLMRQEQLAHTLFPLSELTKPEVRTEAEQRGLHVAGKKDSVGICFIGDINVHEFLRERLGENPGEVVNTKGDVIGTHTGLWFYTVGQRHGFTIHKKSAVTLADGTVMQKENLPPFYVIRKDAAKNQLIVGFGAETFTDTAQLHSLHWIAKQPPETTQLLVRIRHTGKLIPCTLEILEDTTAKLTLVEPLQGVAEGQSAVIYQRKAGETICLGGGVIGQ